MTTIAIPPGTLIWTRDVPRPVETLQAGETLSGFSPDTFSRVTVDLQRVQIQEGVSCRRVEVGGRIIAMAESQGCSLFDLTGEWHTCTAQNLKEGDFLPVDRLIPVPSSPIALPPLDHELSARLDEDPVALSDALYDSAAYFREMEKRSLRLTLYELCGYLCGTATMNAEHLEWIPSDGVLQTHYAQSFVTLFGRTPDGDQNLTHQLMRWMGDGLADREHRRVPGWLWSLSNPACSAFLRGFFDMTASVTEESITVCNFSQPLLGGIQTALGRLHIESTLTAIGDNRTYQLTIRNVRRFAEWVNSNVTAHNGVLRHIYAREPRYPSDSTARLPLNVIRPALERIRNRHALPQRTPDTMAESEATRLENLRLLATAFQDSELRDVVNQQLYLEPVTSNVKSHLDTLFILSVTSPATVIANGVVIGGSPLVME